MVVPYLMDTSHERFGAGTAGFTASDAFVLPPKLPAPTMNVDS